MDISKYEIFLSIADRGSYSKVCEEYNYTQSGISKMMNSMEKEIGFPLIISNNKGISLTPEGEKLLPLVRQLVKDNEILEEEYSIIRGIETGKVRIGSFPTISYAWIPELIQVFHEKYPKIHVEVIEDNNIKLLEQWLSQGFIDLGIFSKQPNTPFDWLSIMNDPFVVLMQENHEMANEAVFPINRLLSENVVLFRSHEGEDPDTYSWRRHLDGDFKPAFTTNSDFTAIRVVEKNDFVTVIPELIAKYAEESYKVTYRPLDVCEGREIGIAIKNKEKISPAVKKFIAHMKENVMPSL